MKFRLFALIFACLSLVGWAQDTPAAPNSTPAPQAQACCHHNMADRKTTKVAAITPRPMPRMPQPVAAKTSAK